MSVATPDVLAQWDDWSSRCTDRLFDLDARVQAAGTDDDRLDVAAAFLARKAISVRLDEIRAASATANGAGRQRAAALAAAPVVDDQGGPVAADLAAAAALVDAILARVEGRLGHAEQAEQATGAALAGIDRDIALAQPLVDDLGIHANRLADLRRRADAAPRTAAALAPLATEAATLLADLHAADEERSELFLQLPGLPARLELLREREAAVRKVVATAREKVLPLPNLAVPSVDALSPLPTADALHALPWPAARAQLQPALTTVARLAAAFDEVERRFGGALRERDDLRGLLQAFRDKAGASRLAEDPTLEAAFKAAEAVLWTAPCDLDRARPLVSAYTEAVNTTIRARATERAGDRPGDRPSDRLADRGSEWR